MPLSHPQVEVDLGWCRTMVDIELKTILEILNHNEYHTTLSCQDNAGKVWIQFYDVEYLRKFLTKCLNYCNQHDPEYVFEFEFE